MSTVARELLMDLGNTAQGSTHSETICLLKAVRDTPMNICELTAECDVSRSTIYGKLTPLVDAGLVDRTNDGSLLTGAGAIVLRLFMRLDTQERSALAQLPTSASRRKLLELLADRPATKSELNDQCQELSYSAIRLATDQFHEKELVYVNKSRQYELTDDGRTAIECEKHLFTQIKTILEHISFFRHTTTSCAGFPVHALDETWVVTGPKERPRAERNEYVSFLKSLDPTEIDQICLFSAYYDHEMAELFLDRFLNEGAQIDIISPESALHNVPTARPKARLIRNALKAPNLSWQLCSESLPIGCTLIDREYVIFYPRQPVGGVSDSGMLFSEDKEIIEWARELFAAYESKSKPPKQQILQTLWSLGVDLSP
jgi:predicted transcriptional regulator